MKKLIMGALASFALLSTTSCAELLNDALGSGGPETTGTIGAAEEQGKTLLALYLIGSDLEDGNGDPQRGQAGTSDFNEIVEGYQALSADEQANVDILVGFGGANKPGWTGIRYADTQCIIEDSADGVYGNASCYSYQDPSANMGDVNTLSAFMNTVNQNKAGAAKTVFTFWDHGASYMGVGPDSNYGSQGILTMQDLYTAFESTGSSYDIIGFDACLMASVEVAQAVHPFGRYMLASEELEPGHGWDYDDMVRYMGKNPKVSTVSLGTKFVDSFIDSPRHQGMYSNNKTLSLVDLSRFQNVATALDNISNDLLANIDAAYPKMLTAASNAEAYGVQNKNSIEIGIDLKHYSLNFKKEAPELASGIDALVSELDKYTIYSKREASKPNAYGVSISSPRSTTAVQNNVYNESNAPSRAWHGLTQKFVEKGQNDTQDPVIVSETQCDESFICLEISDDVGIDEALSVNALQDPENENQFYITSTINMDITRQALPDGMYGMYIWEGDAEVLCDGPCNEDLDNGLGIPLSVENLTEDNKLLATSDGILNGRDVVFHFIGGENGIEESWAVPYQIDDLGNVIMSRDHENIKQGDTLQFSYPKLDVESEDLVYELSDPMTLSQTPQFESFTLPGTTFYFALASDLKGNFAVSEPRFVE